MFFLIAYNITLWVFIILAISKLFGAVTLPWWWIFLILVAALGLGEVWILNYCKKDVIESKKSPVFCGDCKYYRHYSGLYYTAYICFKNVIPKHNFADKWNDYGDPRNINKHNNCERFSPKFWKRIFGGMK